MKVARAIFKPYISADKKCKELSFRSVFLGMLLSLVFAAANAYLGLKVGMTISASIPAVVISMALMRAFRQKATILEHNIVQTTASVGEGLAAGVIFTLPALFLLGSAPTSLTVFLISMLGGVLGVLFMIPMRRYVIVQEHGILPFPEGTACAEILKASEEGCQDGRLTGWGLLIGAVYKGLTGLAGLWKESVQFTIGFLENTIVSLECTPALFGVGFIIGPRIASVMLAGGALSWWVVIPLIKTMAAGGDATVFPSTIPVAMMSAKQIWSSYVRYIGVGAIATGGVIALLKIAPVIKKTFTAGFKELFNKHEKTTPLRTERDIPLSFLLLGSLAVIITIYLLPTFKMNLVTIVMLTIIGFFFVCVTSITVGLIGSSSNPVSGMTITTLLLTCFIFVALGWTERFYLIAAIVMGSIACVAICLASNMAQDLKTGFLLGATPKSQQVGEILGLIFPAIALGGILVLFNQAYGFGSEALPAPQATLIAMLVNGVMSGDLPVTLVLIGVVIGLIAHVLKLPILPLAMGIYLPLFLSVAIAVGGIAAGLVKRFTKQENSNERGILFSSGLVAGDACLGVIIALLAVLKVFPATRTPWLTDDVWGLIAYLLLGAGLVFYLSKRKKNAA